MTRTTFTHSLPALGRILIAALAPMCATPASAQHDAPGALTLHYDKPAAAWTEALPVGNGAWAQWYSAVPRKNCCS
jgi:alpha-L-fucosidase 2